MPGTRNHYGIKCRQRDGTNRGDVPTLAGPGHRCRSSTRGNTGTKGSTILELLRGEARSPRWELSGGGTDKLRAESWRQAGEGFRGSHAVRFRTSSTVKGKQKEKHSFLPTATLTKQRHWLDPSRLLGSEYKLVRLSQASSPCAFTFCAVHTPAVLKPKYLYPLLNGSSTGTRRASARWSQR